MIKHTNAALCIWLSCLLSVGVCLAAVAQDFTAVGNASFYASKFEGRKTSSGEIFRQSKLTCAHRTLPFGTMLKVTNLNNDSSIVVRVNDRGPYGKGRVIDLTLAGAKKLNFVNAGVTRVALEILANDTSDQSHIAGNDSLKPFLKVEAVDTAFRGFSVKVGSYGMHESVLYNVELLKREYDCETRVQLFRQNGIVIYRLFAGSFKTREKAEKLLERIKASYPDAFVSEIE